MCGKMNTCPDGNKTEGIKSSPVHCLLRHLTMNTLACLLSSLLAASCCLLSHGREVTQTLELNNGLNWGTWGPKEYCPEGSYAEYLEAKFEPYSLLDTDETALNALRLYCITLADKLAGYIMSTEGAKGKWQDIKACSVGFLTGLRARVLGSQGLLGDDVAVENVQLECDHGRSILTAVDGAYARIPLGVWGEWSACPKDSAICGIQVRYNGVSVAVDDAAVSDMHMYCCSLNETSTYTT